MPMRRDRRELVLLRHSSTMSAVSSARDLRRRAASCNIAQPCPSVSLYFTVLREVFCAILEFGSG
jgi:hypothetical protein